MLLFTLGCATTSVNAASRDWTGAASGYWSDPNNWSPTGVPQNGERLYFHNDSLFFDISPMFNDLTNFVADELLFTAGPLVGNTHWELFGNTLTISNGVDNTIYFDSQVNIHCDLKLAHDARFFTGSTGVGPDPLATSQEMDMHVSGSVDLNGHTLRLAVFTHGDAYGHMYMEGVITGSGDVVASNLGAFGPPSTPGIFEFKGPGNDFSGTLFLFPEEDSEIILRASPGVVVKDRLDVSRGTVKLERSEQIGDGATVRLRDNAKLLLNGHGESILNLELITDSNDTRPAVLDTGGGGLLGLFGNISAICSNASLTPVIKGNVTLTSGEHIFNTKGSVYAGLDIQAQILGDGNFTKTGPSALLLTASNSCNSTISIAEGTLDVRHPHALGDTAGPTQIFGGALLLRNVGIADETLFALGQSVAGVFPGSVLNSIGSCAWSGPATLYTNLIVNGDMTFSGPITGTGGLGCFSGTVYISADNTYSGATYVSHATVQVDGFQPQSPIDLHDQGRLQGNGTVGSINVRGISPVIAPGNGPGILTCNNLDGAGNSGQLEIELNSTTPGSGYDQLVVNGAVNLTGLGLRGVRNFSPALGDSFTIIVNDGIDAVIGTLNGLRQDSQARIGGESFHVNYAGGDGNDVVLTRVGHDITWTNTASGDWNVAANWSPNLVPGTNDTVFINKNVTVTLNTAVNCYSLTMGTAASPTLTGAGDLTLKILNLNGLNIGGSLNVTVIHEMTWTGGTMSGSGRTVIQPGAQLNLANVSAISLNGRTLENGGTILWTTGNFGMSGAVITNRPGALFDARTTTGLNYSSNPGSRFDNAGTFRKSVAGTTTIFPGLAFNNDGAVEIQAGTLTLFGGGTHNGTFAVPAGTTLSFAGGAHTANAGSSITGTGNFNVSGGTTHTLGGLVNVTGTNQFGTGTANVTGDYICTNNTLATSGGTVNFDGTGTVSPAVFNMASTTLGGSQTVTVLDQMNWTRGTMTGSGRTIIPPGATLNIAASGSIVGLTAGRTLENGGTILWTAGNFTMSSAVITNRTGALFEARNALGLNYGSSPGSRFDNAGTFRKSVNTGTTTFGLGMVFNNFNTVDLQEGILAANGGYNSTASSLLHCSLGGTTPGTGYARLQVTGTIPLNGTLGVSLLPGFTPATNDVFIVVTATARTGTFTSFNYPADRVTMQMSNTPNSVVVRPTGVAPIPRPVLLTPQLIGTNALLTWTTISNVAYRLEFNPTLSPSNWNALAGDVVATSNTASKLDPLTTSNRFYRVRVLP